MNHYVYWIEDLKKTPPNCYIGVRSCKCKTEDDKYRSSSEYLKADLKNPTYEFTKTILKELG